MKKLLLSSVVVVLLSTTGAFAQVWGGGVKVGSNFSSVSGLPAIKQEMGVTAGVFAVRDINCWFSVQQELMYSQQGFRQHIGNSVYRVEMDYINMPVLAKFYTIGGLNMQVGAQFGYLIHAKELGHQTYGELWSINKFNADMLLGLAYDFNCGLIIEGRYALGLKDFHLANTPEMRNATFQLTAGWRF